MVGEFVYSLVKYNRFCSVNFNQSRGGGWKERKKTTMTYRGYSEGCYDTHAEEPVCLIGIRSVRFGWTGGGVLSSSAVSIYIVVSTVQTLCKMAMEESLRP